MYKHFTKLPSLDHCLTNKESIEESCVYEGGNSPKMKFAGSKSLAVYPQTKRCGLPLDFSSCRPIELLSGEKGQVLVASGTKCFS